MLRTSTHHTCNSYAGRSTVSNGSPRRGLTYCRTLQATLTPSHFGPLGQNPEQEEQVESPTHILGLNFDSSNLLPSTAVKGQSVRLDRQAFLTEEAI
jgi:hypothetical protein